MKKPLKKYNKFVATAATATLVASAIVPVASAASFSDVAETNSHATNIDALVEAGIIKGYEDGTFRPGTTLTRGHVVKMLGKWVEAQGFTIPTNYISEARFTDLAVDAKDQELVKYAALVADTGVFNGSNGELNASGDITRENMALVLDRAYKAVEGSTLVELAAGSEELVVTDLATAKAEAKSAIQALRNLGISNVETFAPKSTVTRGQFASFLNRTINVTPVELTVKSAVATNATMLEVILSDDSTHVVTLPTALEANKATAVTFTIGEQEYTATVTYLVPDLAVASVQAIGEAQVEVKFNKAIDKAKLVSNDALLADIIKIDDVDAKNLIATVSEDNTTVTLTGVQTVGVHKIEITNKVVTKAGEKLPAFEDSFRVVADTVRPEVASVTALSKYVYEVTFTEPVTEASAKNVVASYTSKEVTAELKAPSTIVSKDGKTVTITFDSKTVANEEIQLAFAGLTDLATKANVASPIIKTVTISDADQVKPTVTSVTATSATNIAVKFSEKVTVAKATAFTFNGNAVTKVAVDKNDATIVNVTVAATTTSGSLVIDQGAVADLSNNENAKFAQTVYFVTDQTAPTFVSSKVKEVEGKNVLELTMSEEVSVKTLAAQLSFKFVDKYGITKEINVAKTNVSVNADDKTKVEITLPNTIEVDGSYTVEFAKESFVDGFSNVSEKFSVSFENKPVDVSSNKLELAASNAVVASTVTERIEEGQAFVDVTFAKAVNVASATDTANYTVEGATVSKVELQSNNPSTGATVRVFITADTVELTGNYNVTVSGVKGYDSTVTVMDSQTVNISINENLAPVVESVFVKNATTVELTFNEAVDLGAVKTAADFEFFVAGEKVDAKIDASSNNKVITVTIADQDINKLLADKKVVELRAASTIDIADVNGNVTSFKAITLK